METGIVKEILSSNRAIVIVKINSECSVCKNAGNCLSSSNCENLIETEYNCELSVGEEVFVDIKPFIRVASAAVLFFVPTVFLFLFYYFSRIFFTKELINIFSSILGLIISFILIIILFKLNLFKKRIKPRIIKKTET